MTPRKTTKHLWQLPDSAVLPEEQYFRRREFLRIVGLGFVGSALFADSLPAATTGFPDSLNPSFKLDGVKLTSEDSVTSYNNFYEWGFGKEEPKELSNKGWKTEPWTLEIGGLCRNPRKIEVNDLVKLVGGIERRNYRHRCVEAWSMVIPWDGFPLAKLIELSKPDASAKFVRFISFLDPDACPGQRSNSLPWPYTEGLTLPEATNELAFVATGLYGRPLRNQNGAPIRMVVPWKYGFKSAKSVVKIEFVTDQPKTTWNELAPDEYGFYANVNPSVDHPRWSQATERVIGGGLFSGRRPTELFNGYAKQVAHLYEGLDLRKNL